MKLILCKKCHDVIKLDISPRTCKCKGCGGRYIDDLHAEYWGSDSVPLGFSNSSLVDAVSRQPESGQGCLFTAFVIPIQCDTFKKV
jgi:hypothetical protein